MKILFIHRGFPAQFKYLTAALSLDPNNTIKFITEDNSNTIPGIEKVLHKSNDKSQTNSIYLKNIDLATQRALSTAKAAEKLKQEGFIPDIIYGFSGWGSSMLIKDIFPNTPFILYCEWYLNPSTSNSEFEGTPLSIEEKLKLRCDNAHVLTSLSLCDAAIAPTQWQKEQFPKPLQEKITVIHDGVDSGMFTPNPDAKFFIQDKNLELTTNDEIITYGTRGFEPARGFPQVMEAVSVLLKKRPNAHFIIAGEDKVYYSTQKNISYKNKMLKQFDINPERVHFVGTLPYKEYLNFLQVSSCHIYLTYPFVLSWSILDAMSAGCCIVGSNTQPVQEVIKDKHNGYITNFHDVNNLVETVEFALNNQEQTAQIKKNARETILEKYDLLKCLSKQITFLEKTLK